MAFLQNLFLESPAYLGVFSFFLFGIALFIRRSRPETVGRWILPAALGLILLLFGLQSLVETQRERVWSAMLAFVGAIEAGSGPRALEYVSNDYEADGMDRAGFAEFLVGTLERYRIYDTRFHHREIMVERGQSARMVVAARATVSREGGIGELHWGRWVLEWRREAGEWRIVSIQPEMLDGVDFDSLRQLRGHLP